MKPSAVSDQLRQNTFSVVVGGNLFATVLYFFKSSQLRGPGEQVAGYKAKCGKAVGFDLAIELNLQLKADGLQLGLSYLGLMANGQGS